MIRNIAAGTAVLVLALTVTTNAGANLRRCGRTSGHPPGFSVVTYANDITARGVSCATARRVVRTWLQHETVQGTVSRFGGWKYVQPGETVRATKGSAVVSFYAVAGDE